VLGTVDSAAAGQTVLLQTVPVIQAGTYRLDASSLAGIGRYRVRAVLNALIATTAHTTQETAQSLNNSFISLGGAATRGAVRGNLDGVNSDWYSFTLNAGEPATLALTHDQSGSDATLELYSSDFLLLAMGRGDATNVDRYLADFLPTATGIYYARISGTAVDPYSFLLTRGATFDRQPNTLPEDAQRLNAAGNATATVQGNLARYKLAILSETESNNTIPLANDLTGSFVSTGGSDYQAVVTGTISAGNDLDWDFYKIHAGPGDRLRMNGTYFGSYA
jgi:hypothetical protein